MEKNFATFLKDHRSLFLDSMIFIYFFEGFAGKEKLLKSLFSSIEEGRNRGYTSLLTVSEVLVKPYKEKDHEVINEYLRFFEDLPHFSLLPFTKGVALKSAQLRASYRFKTPDAIQLATALVYKVEGFITADKNITMQGLPIFYI